MNSWQIKLIHVKLGTLIRVTRCTETLKALLVSKELLSDEEVQNITAEEKNFGDIQASSKLYSILRTRKNGFFGLMEALQDTRQTGAWSILRSGIQEKLSTLKVKLSGDTILWNELFPLWTIEDSVKCLDSEDAMKEFCKLLSDDIEVIDIDMAFLNINPHPLYIPRFVSNRVRLEASTFKENRTDVFAFKGIDKYELVELVQPYPARSSTSQLTAITCRHIYLDEEEDWDYLRETSEAPLHLISKEKGAYVLQRSTKITDTILSHASNLDKHQEVYISEDQFAAEICSSQDTKGICVCDIPGMGKTWLMESLAKKLQTLSTRTIILCTQLSAFAAGLTGLPKSPDNPLKYILEVCCSSKLVSCILKSHAKMSDLKKILLLDGFDEIRGDCVGITTEFLKQLSKEDNIMLVISSRPRMRKHLEETFKIISYDIWPFGREDQVNAIVGHWQFRIQHSEIELRQFAEQCIKVVKEIQCEESKNLLGVPLKCYILAEVNYKHAYQIARRNKRLKVTEEVVIKSTCDLYEQFVESRISKVLTGPDSGSVKKRLLSFYTHQAFKLLLSEELPLPLNLYLSEADSSSNRINEIATNVGIVMSLDSNCQCVFLHRSFAEYFVGKFFAEFWKSLDQFDDMFLRAVGCYFVKNVLTASMEGFHRGFLQVEFRSEFFYDRLLQTTIRSDFNNRTVLWFMNSLCHPKPIVIPRLREAFLTRSSTNQVDQDKVHHFDTFKTMLKSEVFVILIACIKEHLGSLLSIILQVVQVFFQPFEYPKFLILPAPYREKCVEEARCTGMESKLPDISEASVPFLLYRIALSGLPETAHELLHIFPKSEDNYLLKFCDKFPLDFVSPLEVSIIANNVDMFAYFYNKVKIPVERLIFACLMEEKLCSTDISWRAEMFGRILAVNKDKPWTVNTQDLVEYLESSSNMYVRDRTRWICFAFRHNLSLYKLPRANKVGILEMNLNNVADVEMFQLLHLLFENITTQRYNTNYLATYFARQQRSNQDLKTRNQASLV